MKWRGRWVGGSVTDELTDFGDKYSRFDPSGFIFEHYVDGDLLTADEPTHRSQAGPGSLHVWGK